MRIFSAFKNNLKNFYIGLFDKDFYGLSIGDEHFLKI